MSLLAIEQLTKRYGSRLGIDRLNLSVQEGAVYGFLGPNGSGKTTTIRILLGFLRPSAGRACVFGHDCWGASRLIKSEIGYVPGDLRLHTWMTGRSALQIVGQARGRDLAAKGAELADYFGLEMTVKVMRMSRGMRQKLGLILALVHEPKLLILDEPTTSLDPLAQERLYDHIRVMARNGHTVFFSSHVLSEVEDLCDRVAILREGRLVTDETIDHLRDRAPRAVTIRWKSGDNAEPATPPEMLALHRRIGRVWECDLNGKVTELIEWLAGQSIEDVEISRPNLESLFRQYYRGGDT
ncbi:MAG: ABC transporter ATP-binding protein [Planctomycetes bacterium]|nr:ABC transporter ATP-binding protein [Planctomycetota bacterium]